MRTAATEVSPRTGAAEDWLTPGRFALVLALLIFAMFPGVLLGATTFVVRDFGVFGYPLAYYHREHFWRGEVPLWNPLSSCGVPFLAQWNTLTLYPLSLIYLVLPLSWSLSFFCLVHLFGGGLGMYFLARGWTRHGVAAALAGVIFSVNGLSLNSLMWPNMIAAFGWLPWVVLLAQRAWREGGKHLVWAALAGAMQMLAGGPETILLTWLFLFLLACGDGLHDQGPWRPIMSRFLGMVFLVALICAAQLLPFLELLSRSERDGGFGSSGWPMPIWGWANFLVPLFRTYPTAQRLFLQPGQYWTSSYYAGIGTLLLGAVAVRRVGDWRVRLMASLTILGLVLALGDGGLLYRALHTWLPGFGLMRYPVKFVILVLALAPLLAAFGLAALDQSSGTGEVALLGRFEFICALAILLLIGAILWLGWRFPVPGQDWKAIWQNGLARAGFLMLILFVTAAFLKSQGRRRVILAGLLLIFFWLDFVKHVPNQNPTVAPSVYAPGWASAQAKWQGAAPRPGGSRVMIAPLAQKVMWSVVLPGYEETYLWNRLGFFEDCNLLENVPQVYGLFSLTPRQVLRATLLPYMRADRNFPGLLDFLAVSQITAPGKNSDWVPRPTAMPFVTAGQQPMFADGTAAFDAFYQTNLDLRKIVFLPPEARVEISAVRQPEARAEVAEFADERIWIRAESPVACLVVLSQTYYPAWKAFLDGRAVKIWRANYAFQAVQVPAGSHQLQLRYEDRPFQVGLVLSGLGLMCCLSLWLVAHWRKMRLQTLVRARLDQGPEAFDTELLFPSRRHQASAGAMLQL